MFRDILAIPKGLRADGFFRFHRFVPSEIHLGARCHIEGYTLQFSVLGFSLAVPVSIGIYTRYPKWADIWFYRGLRFDKE